MTEKLKQSLESLYNDIKNSSREFYSENVKEILKTAGKSKPKKAIYSAAFLDEGSREDLYNWWKMHVKEELLDKVPSHSHMTIKFKPSEEQVLSLPIGESDDKFVRVTGFASDDMGQAVMVEPSDKSFLRQDGGIPHITISVAEDVGFVYSNELLARGVTQVKAGPELRVKIGLFLTNQSVVYDLDDTIYSEERIEVGVLDE